MLMLSIAMKINDQLPFTIWQSLMQLLVPVISFLIPWKRTSTAHDHKAPNRPFTSSTPRNIYGPSQKLQTTLSFSGQEQLV